MLDPLSDLRDLMSQVKMFAQLEDDVKQVEKITVTSNRMEIPFKKRKERSIDYESQVRQGVNVIFKELIYKLIARI